MKKLLFVAAALLAVTAANAQVSFNLGYENVSNSVKSSALGLSATDDSSINGFNFSYTDNINLVSDLNVNVGGGLYFDFNKDSNDTKDKELGLFIPVDFNYGFNLGSDLKLSIFAGPTFELGIMCKTVDKNDNELNWYDDDNLPCTCKRFNIYAGCGIMLDFQDMLRLQISHKWGLNDGIKACNLPATSMEAKYNLLSVSLGYLF